MAFEHVTDHEDRALARLLTQYADKDGVRALVSAGAGAVQTIEDVVWQLYTLRTLGDATGTQLDTLGAIVGQAREASTDARYRARIRGRILANRSNNSAEAIIGIAQAVVNDANLVAVLTVVPPAAFVLELQGVVVDDDTADVLADLVRVARAAGIGAFVQWSTEAEVDTLTCDATAAFLASAASPSDTTIDLATGTGARLPLTGSVIIDQGTTVEETIAYYGLAPGTDTLQLAAGLANAHDAGAAVVFDSGITSDGFGDDGDASVGGVLASVAGA